MSFESFSITANKFNPAWTSCTAHVVATNAREGLSQPRRKGLDAAITSRRDESNAERDEIPQWSLCRCEHLFMELRLILNISLQPPTRLRSERGSPTPRRQSVRFISSCSKLCLHEAKALLRSFTCIILSRCFTVPRCGPNSACT